MSVLIKGETLPKCCYTCPISNYDEFLDELFCNYNGNVTQFLVNRHPDCPLVDVPTPHGRLVDADNIYTSLDGYLDFTEGETPTIIEEEL